MRRISLFHSTLLLFPIVVFSSPCTLFPLPYCGPSILCILRFLSSIVPLSSFLWPRKVEYRREGWGSRLAISDGGGAGPPVPGPPGPLACCPSGTLGRPRPPRIEPRAPRSEPRAPKSDPRPPQDPADTTQDRPREAQEPPVVKPPPESIKEIERDTKKGREREREFSLV